VTMNGVNYVVRLRGLPWNSNVSDIRNFLQGCNIRQTQFVTNDQGRLTGECFVSFESKEDFEKAKSFDKKMMGARYIEVFESNSKDMFDTKNQSNNSSNKSSNDNWQEAVVRIRGLPYDASKDDVINFFNGLDIAQNGVHISASKPAGEAFVAFTNMNNALRALEYNRKNMGRRYIEVFKSTYAEARSAIVADNQSPTKPKGSQNSQPLPPPTSHQGNYMNQNGHMNMGNNYNNLNSYHNGPPMSLPPTNDYNSYDGIGGNNYPNGSLKRPVSVAFIIKLRGVPFEAGENDIYKFFEPVVPIRLEPEETPRGRPPVWYAEFGSREEATEAMTFHKNYMGSRYIELLPMYDELNRSKMIRT